MPPDTSHASESAQYEIAVPTLDHAEGIATVHVTAWHEAYGDWVPARLLDEAARARRVEHWTRTLTDPEPGTVIRVALSGGAVVGFALAGPSREETPARDWELQVIYVLAAWYGSGVAQDLFDAVVGGRPAELWVFRDNPRAQGFYRRNGFRPDGTEQVLQRLNGAVEIRMVR